MYIEGSRGFWTGFVRAFYLDSHREVNPRCFSHNLANDIFFVSNFIEGNESVMQVVKFVTTFSKIINDNLNYCGYAEAIEDIEKFCSYDYCTPTSLIKNASENLFHIIGDLQGIADALRQFPVKNKEDAFLATYQIGADCGKFLRTIFMFYSF